MTIDKATRDEVKTILDNADATFGKGAGDALDVMVTGFVISAHAGQHCDELEDDASTFAAGAFRKIIVAYGLEAKNDAIIDEGERIIGILADARKAATEEQEQSSTPAAPKRAGPTLH